MNDADIDPRILAFIAEKARSGMASLMLQALLKIEIQVEDPELRWQTAKRVLGMMTRGEV